MTSECFRETSLARRSPRGSLPHLHSKIAAPTHPMATQKSFAAKDSQPIYRTETTLPLEAIPLAEKRKTQDRARVGARNAAVREAAGENVEVAFVDQGYPGEKPAGEVATHGVRRGVVKLAEARRGFVLLPSRWGSGEHSAGPRVFAAWHGMTNAWHPPSPAFATLTAERFYLRTTRALISGGAELCSHAAAPVASRLFQKR